MNGGYPYLTVITFAPLVGALVVALLSSTQDRAIKLVALVSSLASLALSLCI